MVFILVFSGCMSDNKITLHNNKTSMKSNINYNKPWVSGIVLDAHKGVTAREYGNHPLLSWVLLREKWSVVNPAKGVYNWSTLDERIAEWSSYGKKIIISISPMGQDKLEDAHTPGWIYSEGVKKISYKRNNKPESVLITVPKTWDENRKSYDKKYFRFYSEMVKKLGEKYGNDKRVGAVVVAIGHLGAMTANPNPNGARAFKENGWKVDYYEDFVDAVVKLYKKEFPNKRLFINPTPLVIFEKKPPPSHTKFYRDVILSKSKQLAQEEGISLWAIGVSENEARYMDTGIPNLLNELSPLVMEDNHQQGIGDDWPMYSPQFRKEGLRRDVTDFKKCIEHAIGGTGDVPKSRVSFISFLESTLKATYPGHPEFNQEVYNITLWALKNLEKHPHK